MLLDGIEDRVVAFVIYFCCEGCISVGCFLHTLFIVFVVQYWNMIFNSHNPGGRMKNKAMKRTNQYVRYSERVALKKHRCGWKLAR